MLRKLVIRNYAIIDSLTLEPDDLLNTITGETGAGKSIILGALSLILGDRADTSVVNANGDKAVVEGHFFTGDNESLKQALAEEELDDEEICIIRREITAAGKSRAFVNDSPVNLSTLNKITSLLVDLHQQFGYQAINDDRFQVDTLDAVCGTLADRQQYTTAYTSYRKVARTRADLTARLEQWQREADYKEYLYNELKDAAFTPNEIEELEQQMRQLANAEKIVQVLDAARLFFSDGDQPALTELRRINQQLQPIAEIVAGIRVQFERLSSVYEELKDVAAELEEQAGKINLDPDTMQRVQERLDLGYKLLKKHGLADTASLMNLKATLEAELKATTDLKQQIEDLDEEANALLGQARAIASVLGEKRRAGAKAFIGKMNELLALVGMPNARFEVGIAAGELTDTGADEVTFLLDANRSGQFLPVQKSASGGEMSRMMLCLKSITANALHMPTLIFDEVDAGISGEAARQVGALLLDLAQYHQVICITHQPQVAAKGTRHFYVYKQDDGTGRLTTRVRTLETADRVLAIARMIGGEQPSEAAISNARELVEG